jgi:hypothetical protein
MSEDPEIDHLLRQAAFDSWDEAVKDPDLPLFARLRALENQLASMGMPEAHLLLTETRASMAFAASRAEQVLALAKLDSTSPSWRAVFIGGQVVTDLVDLRSSLVEGIGRLEARKGSF